MKELILGMGNPILSDDGVGLVVAKALEGRIAGADVAVSAMIGLDLLDVIAGYDRVYVIDAMCTRGGLPGEVKKISEEGGAGTMHLFSSHGLHFFELMELGDRCGLNMPEVRAVYGIEIGDSVCFGNCLSPELQEKVASIMETILSDIASSSTAQPDRAKNSSVSS
ncbi:MAG TPA: hydrogenase maturation protease [Desulfomonilia bacterium]|nr:hydrogenase maturation protease [Desulfomonilia bacterium]